LDGAIKAELGNPTSTQAVATANQPKIGSAASSTEPISNLQPSTTASVISKSTNNINTIVNSVPQPTTTQTNLQQLSDPSQPFFGTSASSLGTTLTKSSIFSWP